MITDTIHIVCAADENYIPHVGAMLHSLFEANPDERFAVHFLHREALSLSVLAPLLSLCQRHAASMAHVEVPRAWLDGFPVDNRYPEEAWYRVILPRVLPHINRVLWLDADVIVLKAIRALWAIQLGSLPLAAVPNALLYAFADGVAQMGADRDKYFNTGVLLINLNQMRAENSESALRQAATQHRRWIRFADQDVLNCVYQDRYLRLHLAWNWLTHSYINVPETIRVHGVDEYFEARRDPRVLHFTGPAPIKPWSFKCAHPHRNAYLRHRAAAGFAPPGEEPRRWTHYLVRRLPLRWYAVLTALRDGRYSEMLSYLRAW